MDRKLRDLEMDLEKLKGNNQRFTHRSYLSLCQVKQIIWTINLTLFADLKLECRTAMYLSYFLRSFYIAHWLSLCV